MMLTDEQIEEIWHDGKRDPRYQFSEIEMRFARAIEAAVLAQQPVVAEVIAPGHRHAGHVVIIPHVRWLPDAPALPAGTKLYAGDRT